jgi:hypothetical protein
MTMDSNGKSGTGGSETPPAAPGPVAPAAPSTSGKGKNPSSTNPSKKKAKPNTDYGMKPVTVKILDGRIFNNGNSSSSYDKNEGRPYIEQKYFFYSNAGKQEITRRHVFDVIPNSFEFSQLGSQWNEVDRSGNYSLVDWAKYNLTKVSFRFLVHGKRTDIRETETGNISTVVNDGLDVSIDDQLENIRSIGGAAHPVRIYNMNTLLTDSFRYPYLTKAGGIQWVINDMSVSATRLTPQGRGIATAEVSITLTEYPIIARDVIALPPISPTTPIIPGKEKGNTPYRSGSWTDASYELPLDEQAQYTSSKAEPE